MLKRGDIIFAKMRTSSWWPGIILNPLDCGRHDVKNDHFWIFWFGDHNVSEIECSKVIDFEENFVEKSSSKISKAVKSAIQETLAILADRYNIEYQDPSLLIKWGRAGFIGKLEHIPLKSNSHELPGMVKSALQKKYFQLNYESILKKDEDETVIIFNDVPKDRKSLKEFCVMCCKAEKKIIMQHPCFEGGVCQNCKKNALKIQETTRGNKYRLCFLCGVVPGDLIYCSSSSCLSSFCFLCIDHMVPKQTHSEILQDSNWLCYLCEPRPDKNYIVKRRVIHTPMAEQPPSVPDTKLPIRVISDTSAALSVLKKKNISVSIYSTETTYKPDEKHSKNENLKSDFSFEEIKNISADLVYGSFSIHTTVEHERKKDVISFFTSFYKFLYRLDCTRIVNPPTFFMFLSEASILDVEIKSRVMHFLWVDPIKISVKRKTFYLWTNVPAIKGIKNQEYTLPRNLETGVEESILQVFMEPLKKIFKQE